MANNQTHDQNKESSAPKRGGGPGHGFGAGGGKPKDFKKAMGQLLGYLKRQRPLMFVIMLLTAAAAVVSIVIPKNVGNIADVIFKGEGLAVVLKTGLFLAGLIVAGALANILKSFFMAGITHKTAKRLRTDINSKINRLPLSYFDSRTYGDVLSRITNDVDTIGQSLNQSLTTLIYSVILIIGLIAMMFITSWQLALITLITAPLSFFLIFIIVKISQKHFTSQFSSLGQLNGHIEETYAGHEVVKAYSGSNKAIEVFEGINGKLHNATWKANFLSGLMFPIMNFIANLGLCAVYIFGGWMIAKDNPAITPGIIVSFMLYMRLFANALPQLAQVVSSLQSTAAASERVFEFLNEKELESEKDKPLAEIADVKGTVEFKNVSFGYSPDKKIINDFSATAKPGQKIAIVGPTGAGKTTLVNLLMRFYETDGGEILIDGVSTKDMTREQVHDLFGMVLQDTWLFDGTIKQNIIYAKQGVTDEDVINACNSAGIDHLIRSLPGSYDMLLDENANLSAGQKQLITIARAIVENAPMLILDEATSAVDTRTEILIQQAMDNLMRGRTSFIIAHRLSTIKNADLILVMKDGDIVEQGNHLQLMQLGGFYKELYTSQFERV